MKRFSSTVFAACILSMCASRSFAVGSGGIANEVTSAEALTTLYGPTGSKTDPTTVYNNPASIGDQGTFNSTLGLSYFNFSVKRDGSSNSDKMEDGNVVVPNAAVTSSFDDGKFGFGLAVVSPYGLETEWSETSNVRYVATKSTLKMVDVTPAVSYRPNDKWAFGVGADYFSTFDADLQKKIQVDALNFAINGSLPSGASDANSKLSGDGDGWGYHTGLTFNPTPSHTLGVTYHSEVKTKIEGDLELSGLSGASAFVFGGSDFKTKARTDLFYPQNVQFGYRYNQEDKWSAGLALAWYNWSANRQLAITLPNATPTQRAIAETPTPLDWRDVWSATIGGFYRFNDRWKLNMGAYYLPHVYPEQTFSPAVPDMDKIGIAVGPAFTGKSWSVDTVYNPLFYKTTTINNSVGQNAAGPTGDISGKYKAIVHIVGVNVSYRFGGETN